MASGRRNAGLVLVLLAVGLLAYAAFQGDLRVGLFLIVPYVYGTGILPFLAFVLLMVGAFLWLTAGFERVRAAPGWEPSSPDPPRAGGWEDARDDERPRTRSGGFVLLGPIPIAWGSGKRLMPWLLVIGIGLFVLFFVLPLLLAR